MRFLIVTPVLNGERFIDETILSVVSQAGQFSIRYHIQDGGSIDRTLEKVRRWQRLLKIFPIFCNGVQLTYSSESDHGLYDAIGRGLEACGTADVMAWINADDRFEAGAFATAASLFKKFQHVDWITGCSKVIDDQGMTLSETQVRLFPKQMIAAGVFDARYSNQIIQQEGTFWRSSLWHQAGGINPSFKLAGDFDLWRRFAHIADIYAVDAHLGCFRKRPGQLSTEIEKYWAEIDNSLTVEEQDARLSAALYLGLINSLSDREEAGFNCQVILRPEGGEWTLRTKTSPALGLPNFLAAYRPVKRKGFFARMQRSIAKRWPAATRSKFPRIANVPPPAFLANRAAPGRPLTSRLLKNS